MGCLGAAVGLSFPGALVSSEAAQGPSAAYLREGAQLTACAEGTQLCRAERQICSSVILSVT